MSSQQSLSRQFGKSTLAAALILLGALPLTGCGGSTEPHSVFDETEMAKYRSTPEQIAAGMQGKGVSKKPSAAELKAIEKQAKESAAAGN